MKSKNKIQQLLEYLNTNGTYKIEQNKDLEEVYPQIINYYKSKLVSDYSSNLLQIKTLREESRGRFVADIKYFNPKLERSAVKKVVLELKDKKLLALIKDYEYMLKASLKHVNSLYSELFRLGLTNKDYQGVETVDEMYNFLVEESRAGGSNVSSESSSIEANVSSESSSIEANMSSESNLEANMGSESNLEANMNSESSSIEANMNSESSSIEATALKESNLEATALKESNLEATALKESSSNQFTAIEPVVSKEEETKPIVKEIPVKNTINPVEIQKITPSENQTTLIADSYKKIKLSKDNNPVESPTPPQKNKKINFSNLLIYSRFD